MEDEEEAMTYDATCKIRGIPTCSYCRSLSELLSVERDYSEILEARLRCERWYGHLFGTMLGFVFSFGFCIGFVLYLVFS